jgi:hypothetical protein
VGAKKVVGMKDSDQINLTRASRTLSVLLFAALFVAVAGPVYAEVADKEPTLMDILVGAAIGMSVGFFACLYRPYLAGLTLPWALAGPFGLIGEIEDPSIGQGLLQENGLGYIRAAYAAFWCIALAHLAGAVVHLLVRRKLGRTPFTTTVPSAKYSLSDPEASVTTRPVEEWMER